MKKAVTIIGARPQFIKHAPVDRIIKKYANNITIHTGQHFDTNMSDIFFQELEIDKPKYNLSINWWSHGKMTGEMMIKIEEIVLQEKPDYILVYGDTNSTIAWALVGVKLHIPIIHVESGLRSWDSKMPEEINRILTDKISQILLCPSDTAIENLKNEGITQWVYKTQDPMYLTVNYFKKKALELDFISKLWLEKYNFYFATIHRPSNTDNKEQLESIIRLFDKLNKKVVFSIHPRTKHKLEEFQITIPNNIIFLQPCGYLETLHYMANSDAVITDSWWLQKEAYILSKNIFTVRNTTERIETVNNGKNKLIVNKNEEIIPEAKELIEHYRGGKYIDCYWLGESLDVLFERALS